MRVLSSILFLSLSFLMANEAVGKIVTNNVHPSEQYDGYAYMMFGTESVNYQEKASSVTVESSVTATNIVQMSGGLTKVNDTFDFSIDTVATLLSQSATEQWHFNASSPNILLQENSFDIIGSKLKILLHYKYSQGLRFVAGPAYTLDTFKRYNWVSKHPSTAAVNEASVQEERYASLHAHAGLGYQSYAAALKGLRYNFRATYGYPLWQETTNTKKEFDQVVFSNSEGYNLDFDAYVGYTLFRGLELGFYGGYALQHRKGDIKDVDTGTSILTIEWPENNLSYTRLGMMFVWKFRE